VLDWPWYYHVPGLGLWGLVLVGLVGLKENRNWQAWLILVPLLLVALVWRMPTRLLSMSVDAEEQIGIPVMTGAAMLAVLWLLAGRLAGRRRLTRLLIALVVFLGVGAVSYAGHCGWAWSEAAAVPTVAGGIACGAALVGIALASAWCGGCYTRGRFMGFLWLGMVLATLVGALGALVVVAMFLESPSLGEVLFALMPLGFASVLLASLAYLVAWPFMVLASKSPLYRERFYAALDLQPGPSDRARMYAAWDLPFSTEPTAQPVAPTEIAGAWQFYLDGLGRTVVVDFRADGTFGQAILGNRDGVTECPGGTWHLDGPRVHLDNYLCARTGASGPRTWWVIDTPAGRALFGGDEPDSGSFFRMTRRSAPEA